MKPLSSSKESPRESVNPEDRNVYQRVAAKTYGIVTPANAVSVAGSVLVVSGLRDIATGKTTRGVLKVVLGRLADLSDGPTARWAGTKSPLGEGLDVITDKAEMAMALPVLVKRGILPRSNAGLIFAQSLAHTAFSATAKWRGVEMHPSKEGKLTTFGQWTVIGMRSLEAVARENDAPRIASGLEMAGHVSLLATAMVGSKAVAGYAKEALLPVPETSSVEDINSLL